MLGGGK